MSEIYNQAQENFYVDRGLTPLPQPHLTGMKLKADIVLGDFVFNTIDEFGVTWVITDISGWWQHPEPDMPDIPRGFGDGSYDVKGRYQARIVTLTGTFLAPTPDLVEAARDRLIMATDLVYKGAWLKTGTDGKRSSFMRLSGAPEIETVTARGRTDFSIGLKAADPIKYSWNDQEPDGYNIVEIPAKNRVSGTTGIENILNRGTVAVPVQIEIQGPITAPAYILVNKDTATEKLLAVVSGLRGRLTSSIVNKQLAYNENSLVDILTLTTRSPHSFLEGDTVEISGLAEEYLNGEFLVSSTPTTTTVEFEITAPPAASVKNVVSKKLLSGSATIETSTAHGFQVGNEILVANVDTVFDGSYLITSKTDTTFSYVKSRGVAQRVEGKRLSNNVATLTTALPHGFIVGDTVTVSISDINYDGEFEITAISFDGYEFSYSSTRTNTKATTTKSMTNDVATITTAAAHGLVAQENVLVSGVDATFNGTRTVTGTPTPTTFTYNLTRDTQVSLGTRQRFSGVATFTTVSTDPASNDSPPHGFEVGEEVTIKGIIGNTTYPTSGVVTSKPTLTSFTIANAGQPDEGAISITTAPIPSAYASKRYVASKQLVGGVATIYTNVAHGFLIGETVTITGLGSPFDGTFTITSMPFANTFTYNLSGSNQSFSPAGAAVSKRSRLGSTATIVTSTNHNLTNGQYVRIANMDASATQLNGEYVVSVVNPTTFTYTTTTSGTVGTLVTFAASDITLLSNVIAKNNSFITGSSVIFSTNSGSAPSPLVNGSTYFVKASSSEITLHSSEAGALANTGIIDITTIGSGSGFTLFAAGNGSVSTLIQGAFARGNKTIASAADSGFFNASGSIPFAVASGTASVSDNILSPSGGELDSSGIAVKKNDIPFTPGLVGASIDFGPDLLEIDTLSKDVSLNGAFSGGRAKLDVFTDFFFLEAGNNTIEFYDSTNSSSESLLKIYYRSGWLG
jgi:hypothetical protein